MIFFLSFLQIFFSQNRTKLTPEACSDNTILKGNFNNADSYTVTDRSYSETLLNIYKGGHYIFAGSFCPDETASYLFETTHQAIGGFRFDFEYQGKSDISKAKICLAGRQTTQRTKTLYKNKCYQYYQWCSIECLIAYSIGNIYVTKNGIKAPIKKEQSKGCEITDCLPGYYGPNCESFNDLFCGENPRSDGIYGGDSCVCINGNEPPFCVDMNDIPTGHEKPLINVTKEDSYKVFENKELNEIGFEPYSEIEVIGKIEFPQSSDYEIRLSSVAPTILQIGDRILGESNIKGKYYCDDIKKKKTSPKYVVSIPKTFFKRGFQTFRMKFFTGCGMNNDFSTSLEWKFYRLYGNLSTAPFDSIPKRYLTK